MAGRTTRACWEQRPTKHLILQLAFIHQSVSVTRPYHTSRTVRVTFSVQIIALYSRSFLAPALVEQCQSSYSWRVKVYLTVAPSLHPASNTHIRAIYKSGLYLNDNQLFFLSSSSTHLQQDYFSSAYNFPSSDMSEVCNMQINMIYFYTHVSPLPSDQLYIYCGH